MEQKRFRPVGPDNNANLTSTDFILTAKDNGGSAITNVSIYSSPPFAAYLQTGYNTSTTGTYFHVAADGTNTGSFELTGLVAGEYGAGHFTNVHIIGIRQDNSTITSSTITGTGAANETFTFGAGQLVNFSGEKIKAFKLVFDTSGASGTKPFFEFRNFTITGALCSIAHHYLSHLQHYHWRIGSYRYQLHRNRRWQPMMLMPAILP